MPEPAAAAEEATAAPANEPAAAPQFERTPAPDGAAVYIIEPEDGATVSNPVRVVFGLKGFGVVPAGIERADAGHHHLLVDTEPPPFDAPIPSDDRHRHFGLGQTEAELTLPPGEHRLQLLLGDHLHVPHDPPLMSEPITIHVTE
ncbi:MAG: DUF4399 domain-containing protein [Gammaproteobacteria bacterium]|nr:DUF4399 domain-containing protein [Gammaproteobacteria bacterium]